MRAHYRVDRSELMIISYSVPYEGIELLGQLKISTKKSKAIGKNPLIKVSSDVSEQLVSRSSKAFLTELVLC